MELLQPLQASAIPVITEQKGGGKAEAAVGPAGEGGKEEKEG